jgi:hypothetical protein
MVGLLGILGAEAHSGRFDTAFLVWRRWRWDGSVRDLGNRRFSASEMVRYPLSVDI